MLRIPRKGDTTESDADAGDAAIPAKVKMRFMTVPLSSTGPIDEPSPVPAGTGRAEAP